MKKRILAAVLLFLVMALSACSEVETTEETTKETVVETVKDVSVEKTTETVKEVVETAKVEETTEATFADIDAFSDDIPLAYRSILANCSEILAGTSDGEYNLNDTLGSYYWFADQSLHCLIGDPLDIFCYSLTDLNNDGTDELIIAEKYEVIDKSIAYRAGYSIFNIYTFDGEKAILLAESNYRCHWYIGADGTLINEETSNPAYHEITIYSFEADATSLTEVYRIYNLYSEDRNQVDLYEAFDGASSELIGSFDDPNSEGLWDLFGVVRDDYTAELLNLELVPIC